MPRKPDWKREIEDGLRRENWSIRGPNGIVKVMPLGTQAASLSGYITLGKHLVGKTPKEIEFALGLEFDKMTMQHGTKSNTKISYMEKRRWES